MTVTDVVERKRKKKLEEKEKEKECRRRRPLLRACAMNCAGWRSRCAGISVFVFTHTHTEPPWPVNHLTSTTNGIPLPQFTLTQVGTRGYASVSSLPLLVVYARYELS